MRLCSCSWLLRCKECAEQTRACAELGPDGRSLFKVAMGQRGGRKGGAQTMAGELHVPLRSWPVPLRCWPVPLCCCCWPPALSPGCSSSLNLCRTEKLSDGRAAHAVMLGQNHGHLGGETPIIARHAAA